MFHFSRKRNSNGRHNHAYYILKITTSFLPKKRAPWINQFNHEQTTGRYFSEAREASRIYSKYLLQRMETKGNRLLLLIHRAHRGIFISFPRVRPNSRGIFSRKTHPPCAYSVHVNALRMRVSREQRILPSLLFFISKKFRIPRPRNNGRGQSFQRFIREQSLAPRDARWNNAKNACSAARPVRQTF